MENSSRNNQKTLQEILERVGLSQNESSAYLALLELGRGTIMQIAQRAGMNRTTGYSVLASLARRGLTSTSGKGVKQEYVAESPDRLQTHIKKEAENLVDHLSAITTIIPELKSLHNTGTRPRVRFYEGLEGLEAVYEDTLTSHEPIRAYAAVDDMHKAMPGYFPKYYERRVKEGIAIRAIIPATKIGKDRVNQDKKELRESALIPSEKFTFTPEINIYDNKVMIASWREKLGIIIESAEIAEAMKQVFELSWNEAKRLQEK